MNLKKVSVIFLAVFILSSLVTAKLLYDGKRLAFTENELGMMCLAGAYPSAAFGNEEKTQGNPISMIEDGNIEQGESA
ncbi:MAG: hypothetical protein PHX63_08360, partial [Eubacteriales bacterium]|nr:hypothetical protein [Eubacteriales bacterium]